jgi:hypothetical protein
MIAAAEELNAFVAALGFAEDGTILLAGNPVGRLGGAAVEAAQLASALAPIVYEHAYTRSFPVPDDMPAGERRDLTAILERANTSRSRSEQGWVGTGTEGDGSVLATRHGRTRRFAPGQFMAADGVLPVRPGAPLVAYVPGGSRTAQPGFYYCFGEAFREVNDLSPLVRFYWNVQAAGAGGLVQTLTTLLNRYQIPFEFKIAVRSDDYVRRDNAVLYLSQDLFPAVSTVIMAIWPALAGFLDEPVPLFARRIAPGLGFAEDPGRGDSFGMARSRLVAGALALARAEGGFSIPLFHERFAEAVAEAGLNPDALWLNAGSTDIYAIPMLGSEGMAA